MAPHRGRVSNFCGLPAAWGESGLSADSTTCGCLISMEGTVVATDHFRSPVLRAKSHQPKIFRLESLNSLALRPP